MQPLSPLNRATPGKNTRPAEGKTSLSPEVLGVLKDLGLQKVGSLRVQAGIAFTPTFPDIAQLVLTPDQKNALNALGLQGMLVAVLADEEPNYKEKLGELHEHLIDAETQALLQQAFGLTSPPTLLADDAGSGLMVIQEGTQILESAIEKTTG